MRFAAPRCRSVNKSFSAGSCPQNRGTLTPARPRGLTGPIGDRMTDTYRMFVELPNGAKFRAHGEVSAVRVDVERFYELLIGAPTVAQPTISKSNGTGTIPVTGDSGNAEVA